ncbi:MAG: hypothetical protein JWO54_62 [Candidatus Saccharibacteria bacterium]|nr:hypothetical protein [Candidatus Saccharibacteria bacterium]MDB5180304.1 hypothetical protein [Candidatus Saccharibacteria bacterium]
MYQEEQLIEQLGVGNLPKERQAEILAQLNYKIGEALTAEYSEQQINEYEAIINDDHDVIDAWLSQNVPDYKDSPVYQELASGYDSDPEHINPAKVFASLAWTQVNSPNAQDTVAKVIDQYRQELATQA